MATTQPNHLETLSEIRDLMNRSSRFISLSGLSGVIAGSMALIGIALAYLYLRIRPFADGEHYYLLARHTHRWGMDHLTFFFSTGLIILLISIAAGIVLTTRNARRNGQKVWDALSRRLLVHLFIPLIAGGVFCLGLYYHGATGFVAPVTLIFYGLGLVNASKYTLEDVFYLGLIEIALGCLAVFFIQYGLEFWAVGFGILHIVYGLLVHRKYGQAS